MGTLKVTTAPTITPRHGSVAEEVHDQIKDALYAPMMKKFDEALIDATKKFNRLRNNAMDYLNNDEIHNLAVASERLVILDYATEFLAMMKDVYRTGGAEGLARYTISKSARLSGKESRAAEGFRLTLNYIADFI